MKKITKAKKHNFEEKYRPDPRIQIRSNGQIPQQTLITPMSPIREMMKIPAPAIGIDLGTTTSCVAVFRHGKVEIISNEQGNRTTPSYVAFTEAGLLVGDAAKSQLSFNPNNSIYGAKRLVGQTFENWTAQVDVNHLPFEVVDDNTKLKIKVQHRGENKTFFPQQISSMVFRKMKEVAEAYLGMTIDKAVVSVPACYNIAQRQATMDAGAIAGFTKLRLVNETSAAAIAYAVDKKITDECKVLIFSLGSGSLGASIIFIKDGICDVKSTAGVVHLGGQDFDNRLVDHFVQEFRRKYNRDLTSDKRALIRLRTSCELAKINLSSSNQASIEIDSIFEGIDFHTSITRACFEELNKELFRSIIKPLEKLFQDSHLDKTQIHEIILVGGSTRIPKIQEILRAFFFGKELNKSINPDEAVAYGAAIFAAILEKNNCEELQKFQLQDVAQFSFGIEAPGGNMFNLITRNTKIPTEQKLVLTRNLITDPMTKSIFTKKNKPTQSERSHFRLIKIFEGESAKTSNNKHLENLSFNYFSVKNDVELTFSIDFNGMLNVKTSEKGTNKIVTPVRFRINDYFSKDDIERMIKEARSYITEIDKDESNTPSNRLEICCFKVLSKIENENIMRKVSDNSKAVLMEKCNEILHLVDGNQLSNDEECEHKQEELKRLFNNIIIQSYKEVVNSPEPVPGFSGSNPEDNFTRKNCPQTDTSKNNAVDLIQF